VAAAGVFVNTHPDIILKLDTKEELYRTQDLSCGCDTYLDADMEQMREQLPARLAISEAWVLKQHRGNGGIGVWKIQLPLNNRVPRERDSALALPHARSVVRVRHAQLGCIDEAITLAGFFARCEPYFAADGKMIDQQYQQRLPESMVRCYLVHDKVVGFGHQAINALCHWALHPGTPQWIPKGTLLRPVRRFITHRLSRTSKC
jgi:hypothetical protein